MKYIAKPTFLDRVINYFSPVRGVKRLHARTVFSMTTTGKVKSSAASKDGLLSNWIPKRFGSEQQEAAERETIIDRIEDLSLNDPSASTAVDTIASKTIGVGLKPQSKPVWKRLGITEEQAKEVSEQAEWAFKLFSKEAGSDGSSTMSDILYQTIRTMVEKGEYLNIPVRLDRNKTGRKFSLAIQTLNPSRLKTPTDIKEGVRDGIAFSQQGIPKTYWIAEPKNKNRNYYLNSSDFRPVPARRGHRKAVFHDFIKKQPEQYRGISPIAPAVKELKALSDYFDVELVGAIIANSFPLFIETEFGAGVRSDMGSGFYWGGDSSYPEYQDINPGTVMYGKPGQKPHVIEADRPGNTFAPFVETSLRRSFAAVGLSYEVAMKDFTKCNYVTARAALNDAYDLFAMLQGWLIDHFAQKVWQMVFEDAWLMGMIELPAGFDFYDNIDAWTNALWIPPKRNSVEPYKEIMAAKVGKEIDLLTDEEYLAANGKDVDEHYQQLEREKKEKEKRKLINDVKIPDNQPQEPGRIQGE